MFRGKLELLAQGLELLAQGLYWSSAAFFLNCLPARNVLLVLNYHRIGNPEDDLFDPGIFSATAEQLDEQITFLKRNCSLVALDEAQAFVEGTIKNKAPRCRVLITFDDGYLDNYETAFPILRSHNAQGVFFLVTNNIGSGSVPWWDHIAFLLKTAQRRKFSLNYPANQDIDLDRDGVAQSIRDVLRLYKRPENTKPDHFIQELKEKAQGAEVPKTLRRFLDWNEAREMIAGGMAIGSHTHSHHVLTQLMPEQQRRELTNSRSILRDNLGVAVDAIAYPVGSKTAFSEETQVLAREAGYRIAFSFYGGTNLSGQNAIYDVKRIGVYDQSRIRFRVQLATCRVTGRYWP